MSNTGSVEIKIVDGVPLRVEHCPVVKIYGGGTGDYVFIAYRWEGAELCKVPDVASTSILERRQQWIKSK